MLVIDQLVKVVGSGLLAVLLVGVLFFVASQNIGSDARDVEITTENYALIVNALNAIDGDVVLYTLANREYEIDFTQHTVAVYVNTSKTVGRRFIASSLPIEYTQVGRKRNIAFAKTDTQLNILRTDSQNLQVMPFDRVHITCPTIQEFTYRLINNPAKSAQFSLNGQTQVIYEFVDSSVPTTSRGVLIYYNADSFAQACTIYKKLSTVDRANGYITASSQSAASAQAQMHPRVSLVERSIEGADIIIRNFGATELAVMRALGGSEGGVQ